MKKSKRIAHLWWTIAMLFVMACLLSCGTYRPNYGSIGASAISGASWGVREKLKSDNAAFFKTFPKASQQFWGPDSWLNKYNGRSPDKGRNGKPIWLTDGWHLLGTTTQASAFSSGALIAAKKRGKKWHYLLDIGISFGAYSLSNFIVYDKILSK